MFSRHPFIAELSRLNDALGWRQRVRSIDYYRALEYSLAIRGLKANAGEIILDWGVGRSPLPMFLARRGLSTVALDLELDSSLWTEKAEKRLALASPSLAPLLAIQANGLQLPFADEVFDQVCAVSALEHAMESSHLGASPDWGDRGSIIELARVLRPGGRLVLTVPVAAKHEEGTGSEFTSTYQRRYDSSSLVTRLIEPSGLKLESCRYFGEPGLRWSRFWYRLPFLVKLPFRRLIPFLAGEWLSELRPEGDSQVRDQPEEAQGVCLVLAKADL